MLEVAHGASTEQGLAVSGQDRKHAGYPWLCRNWGAGPSLELPGCFVKGREGWWLLLTLV